MHQMDQMGHWLMGHGSTGHMPNELMDRVSNG